MTNLNDFDNWRRAMRAAIQSNYIALKAYNERDLDEDRMRLISHEAADLADLWEDTVLKAGEK
jgi:hypothetical protein